MNFSHNKKVFLIGAGFDKLFGIPDWKELIEKFRQHLRKLYSENNPYLKFELENIEKENYSPMRELEILFVNASRYEFSNEDFFDFLRKELNINNYKEKINLKKIIFSILKESRDIFITTNISNTFDENNWNINNNIFEISPMSYLPIHGNVFKEDKEIILFESDYVKASYSDKLQKMYNFLQESERKELHIFGYSLNDLDILKTIVKLGFIKIYIYISKNTNFLEDIEEKQFRKIFENGVTKTEFVTPKDYTSKISNQLVEKNGHLNYINLDDRWDYLALIFLYASQCSIAKEANFIELVPHTENDYDKILEFIMQVEFSRLPTTIQAIVNSIEKGNGKKILESIILKIANTLSKKYNTNLIFALEFIAQKHFEYFKGNLRVLNSVKKNLKTFFDKNKSFNIRTLVWAFDNIEFYRKYIKFSNNWNIISQPSYFGFDKTTWIDRVIEILTDKKTLASLLVNVSKYPNLWVYIKDYQIFNGVSKIRRKFFVSLLKIVKNNLIYFKKFPYKFAVIKSYQYSFEKDIRWDLINLINLIKGKLDNKIREAKDLKNALKDYPYISWYADFEDSFLENLNWKPNRTFADLLYITNNSPNLEKFQPRSLPTTMTSNDIIDFKGWNRKKLSEIVEMVLNGKVSWFDLDLVIKYLYKNGYPLEEILKQMNIENSSLFKNNGNVLHCISKYDKFLAYKYLKKSKFLFLSPDAITTFGDSFKNEDALELVNSFNRQKFSFREIYQYDILINTFEGRFINSIVKLFIVNNKYLTKGLLDILNKINNWNNAFKGVIDAFKFILGNFKIDNYDSNYISTFVEAIFFNFNIPEKIISDEYLKCFKIYLKKYFEINLYLENQSTFDGLNHLLFFIRNLEWAKLKDIMQIIDESDLITKNLIWTLFQKSYQLNKSPSYEEFKNSLFFKKQVVEFTKNIISGREIDNEDENNLWELKYAINYLKKGTFKFKSDLLSNLILFCKDYSIPLNVIKKLIFNIEKEDENLLTMPIENQKNWKISWKYLNDNLSHNEKIQFSNHLTKNKIRIPQELIKY